MSYPMMLQLIGAVLNIILNPIMILGLLGCPAMGVRGAAIATVVAQVIAMCVGLFILLTKKFDVKISYRRFRLSKSIIIDIYKVGIPIMVMQAMTSVMILCLNTILIAFSDAAVAVLGLYYKLQNFAFMAVFGLGLGGYTNHRIQLRCRQQEPFS